MGLAACAPPPPRTVPRIVDGQVEQGPFVSPYAYEWFIEGEMSAAKGEHDSAAIAFETATAAPADDVVLMTRLAEEYELSGASRRADRILSLARRYYPESARVAVAEGRVERSRGELDRAMLAFIRARALAPSSDQPVIEMASALKAQGHTQRATAVLLEYIAGVDHAQGEAARRALTELAHRNADAETFERALALDPVSDANDGAHASAQLALDTGQPALATRLLEGALGTPENRSLWLHALVESGDRQTAAAFLATAKSDEVGGVAEHAELLLEIGEFDEALKRLRAEAASPRVQHLRGQALLGRGDYLEAAQVLSEVPFGSSSYEAARLALAECSVAQRRPGAAAEALSLTPNDSLAVRAKLAEIYVAQGDLRAGLRLFDAKRMVERAIVASLFERAGRFKEAAAYYATVQAHASDDPQVRARAAAERLASRGLEHGAIAILERRAAAAPEDLYARVRLVELLQQNDEREAADKKGRATLPLIDDPLLRAHLVAVLRASK